MGGILLILHDSVMSAFDTMVKLRWRQKSLRDLSEYQKRKVGILSLAIGKAIPLLPWKGPL